MRAVTSTFRLALHQPRHHAVLTDALHRAGLPCSRLSSWTVNFRAEYRFPILAGQVKKPALQRLDRIVSRFSEESSAYDLPTSGDMQRVAITPGEHDP
jgi:hypothetical protein